MAALCWPYIQVINMIQFFKDLATAVTGINDLIDKINAGEINLNINLTVNGVAVDLPPAEPVPTEPA